MTGYEGVIKEYVKKKLAEKMKKDVICVLVCGELRIVAPLDENGNTFELSYDNITRYGLPSLCANFIAKDFVNAYRRFILSDYLN